eukprot:jgi/Chlat1/616/Chrsp103S00962
MAQMHAMQVNFNEKMRLKEEEAARRLTAAVFAEEGDHTTAMKLLLQQSQASEQQYLHQIQQLQLQHNNIGDTPHAEGEYNSKHSQHHHHARSPRGSENTDAQKKHTDLQFNNVFLQRQYEETKQRKETLEQVIVAVGVGVGVAVVGVGVSYVCCYR